MKHLRPRTSFVDIVNDTRIPGLDGQTALNQWMSTHIQLLQSGDITLFTPTADTDEARGIALKNAVLAASEKSSIIIPSPASVSGKYLYDNVGDLPSKEMSWYGTSKYDVIITNKTAGDFLIFKKPFVLSNLTVMENDAAGVTSALIAPRMTFSGETLIDNCQLFGGTDVIFASDCVYPTLIKVKNTELKSYWDIITIGGTLSGIKFEFWDSQIRSVSYGAHASEIDPRQCTVVYNANEPITVDFYNCKIESVAGTGAGSASRGLYNLADNNCKMNMYGGSISTSGGVAGTYDIQAGTNNTYLSNVSFDFSKSLGPYNINKYLTGIQTLYLPADSIVPTNTSGCATIDKWTNSYGIDTRYLAFDAVAQENATFDFTFPKSSDPTDFNCQFLWTTPTGSVNSGVVWGVKALAYGNGDNLNQNYGTAKTVASTGVIAKYTVFSDTISGVIPAGTSEKQDLVRVGIYRSPVVSGDTSTVDAWLMGVKIFYKTKALTDD